MPHMTMNETIMYRNGDDSVIEAGQKLVTLRIPDNKYLFQRGQKALAICGNVSVPITIFDSKTQPLDKISPVMLGFDGFFDINTAVREMREIGGRYADVKKNTPFVWIGHISDSALETFSPSAQKSLLEDPMEQYLRNRELTVGLFGPAITYWATKVRNVSKPSLKRFLEKNLPI